MTKRNTIHNMEDIRHSIMALLKCVRDPSQISKSNSRHGSKRSENVHSLHSSTNEISFHAIRDTSTIAERLNEDIEPRNSVDSSSMVQQLSNIPLHVRGRAEKWEIPRSQIIMSNKLGEGQGGVVYKCRWRALDCAAKLLTNHSTTSLAYYDMVNEISIISHLRHPNLVLFLGACTVGNEPLLILSEFMEGGSLEDRFNDCAPSGNQPRPSSKTLFRWIMDLSRAVCFLHNCTTPIIHRDLKPANLLLTAENQLKVSDFGLCKTLKKVREDGTPYQMTGDTGTKRYMAPEVVLSQPQYDEKVDIYSMAMIFWFILKRGVRPFEGIPPMLIGELTSVRGARPPLEGLHWPPMAALIARMWAAQPADRPHALELVGSLSTLQRPPSAVRRASCWARTWAGGRAPSDGETSEEEEEEEEVPSGCRGRGCWS